MGEEDLGGGLLLLARLRCDSVGCQNGRCWALCTDDGATCLALNRSPLIFGISASAALPEAARGGLHGGGLCELCEGAFCSMCPGLAWVRHKSHPGQTKACWGSPESSPQCENVCCLVLRPRRSRLRETRWGATKTYSTYRGPTI